MCSQMAVEILSVDDSFGELVAKYDEFLYAGTQTTWLVDPHFKTVVAYRQNSRPKMYSGNEVISTDPILPGFVVPVSELFQR